MANDTPFISVLKFRPEGIGYTQIEFLEELLILWPSIYFQELDKKKSKSVLAFTVSTYWYI